VDLSVERKGRWIEVGLPFPALRGRLKSPLVLPQPPAKVASRSRGIGSKVCLVRHKAGSQFLPTARTWASIEQRSVNLPASRWIPQFQTHSASPMSIPIQRPAHALADWAAQELPQSSVGQAAVPAIPHRLHLVTGDDRQPIDSSNKANEERAHHPLRSLPGNQCMGMC
jgi:hypothetical protein